MEKEKLIVTTACPLNCIYCTYEKRTAQPSFEDLQARIRELSKRKIQTLMITGGEPALLPSIIEITTFAADYGIPRISLDTTAIPFTNSRLIAQITRCPLTDVVVRVPTHIPEIWLLLTRKPDLFQSFLTGIEQLAQTDLNIYFSFYLNRWNVGLMEQTIRYFYRKYPSIKGILLDMLTIDSASQKLKQVALKFSEAAHAVNSLFKCCRQLDLEYDFAEPRGLPPCSSPEFALYRDLFVERELHIKRSYIQTTKTSKCHKCVLKNDCSGIESNYIQRVDDTEFKPLSQDFWEKSSQRVLCSFTRQVTPKNYYYQDSIDIEDSYDSCMIFVTNRCNMDCVFCWVDLQRPHIPFKIINQSIYDAAKNGVKEFSLTGGEPTLHPDLQEIIAYAASFKPKFLELQTNGVRCANRDYAQSLVEAGLTRSLVALHGSRRDIADSVTRLKGGFQMTVKALHNFLELGLTTYINYVINTENKDDMLNFAKFLSKEFNSNRPVWNLSFTHLISPYVEKWSVPRFTDLVPELRRALEYCLDHEIHFVGLGSNCGIPLCVLDGEHKYFFHSSKKRLEHSSHGDIYAYLDCCLECRERSNCPGVRRTYLELYGMEEFYGLR